MTIILQTLLILFVAYVFIGYFTWIINEQSNTWGLTSKEKEEANAKAVSMGILWIFYLIRGIFRLAVRSFVLLIKS